MAPVTDRPCRSEFCVVVHDVTPFFAAEIDRILDELQPLIREQLVGAVVPQWHGSRTSAFARRQFAYWLTRFGDFVLHGWTHHRETKRGVVSWCTDCADEFARRSLGETLERLRLAQICAQDLLGQTLRGFVPPAWRLAASIAEIRPAGIEYLLRFRSLEPYKRRPIPLATWSWDWGWLPGTHFPGAALGAWCQWLNPCAVPTVVLHPIDVRRGRLAAALRLIRRLLSSGLSPVLPCNLIIPDAPSVTI
jgi:peptidoglycan/xylan/chitin deacetylase (PgdA/CDA1 family)